MKYLKILLLGLVLCGCDLPSPAPGPGPGPSPDPAPVDKVPSLWIETIDSFGARAGDVRKLMTDLSYWASLQERGHHVRHLDVTADADEVKSKLQVFLDVKPPCVIIYDYATNNSLGAAPMTDKASINAVVAKFSDK